MIAILLVIIGFIFLLDGLLGIFSKSFDEYMHRLFSNLKSDKKVLPGETGYFIYRYYGYFRGASAGIGAIILRSNSLL